MNRSKIVIAMLIASAAAARGAATHAADAATPQKSDAGARSEPVVEEVVVTGSFLPRSFDDVGSPISMLDAADIKSDGAVAKVADFLKYLPESVGGVPSVESGLGGFDGPTTYGAAFVDLRGLGANSTLVLLNGQRQARWPLSEGGLTDINGLTPTIAIKRVEVLKDGASGVYGTDAVGGVVNFITYDDYDGVMVEADARALTDDFARQAFTISGMAGSQVSERVHVMGAFSYFDTEALRKYERDVFENGLRPGSSFGTPGSFTVPQRNPVTGQLTGAGVTVPDPDCQRFQDENITFNVADAGGDTFLEGGLCRLMFKTQALVPEERRWNGRAAMSAALTDDITWKSSFGAMYNRSITTGQPTTPVLNLPIVPGENPANPFQAGVRTYAADGFTVASFTPIYALEDPSNPGRPLRDANGRVVVAADPFTNSAGTVSFNEDVPVRFRPYSTSTIAGNDEYLGETLAIRLATGLTGSLSDDWNWSLGYAWSRVRLDRRLSDTVTSRLLQGLSCSLGPNGDLCFNPFGSAVFASPGDPDYNEPAVFQQIATVIHDTYETGAWNVDAILSGAVDIGLPAGAVGVAFGAQIREDSLGQDFDTLITSGDAAFWGNGDVDFSVADQTQSVFLELAVPVFDNAAGTLDLSVAGRYETQDRSGLDSVNPKVSFLYHRGAFGLRGSYASSFLVPSLFQRFGRRSSFGVVSDPLNPLVGDDQVRTFVGGAQNADPQKAKSYNLGVILEPLDRLRLTLDYWNADYTGLLTVETAQAILNRDPNSPLVVRNANNEIVSINQQFFNAGSLTADGVDLSIAYSLGNFTVSSGTSWFRSYEYQRIAGVAAIDGVGMDNADGNNQPIPKWRANVRLGWASSDNRHEVNMIGRYQSEIDLSLTTEVAEAETPIDVQYTYAVSEDRSLLLTLGVINVFDDRANVIPSTGNRFFISGQNPLTREAYVTIRRSF